MDDAKLVSNHAKKKIIDIEDGRLAVQMYNEQNFCSPPPRDVLLEVARSRNANPLPPPKPSSSTGVRLVSMNSVYKTNFFPDEAKSLVKENA